MHVVMGEYSRYEIQNFDLNASGLLGKSVGEDPLGAICS